MAARKQYKPETLLQQSYQQFWSAFNELTAKDALFCKVFKTHPYASVRCYQDYPVGKAYHIVAAINFRRHEIRVGAYFGDVQAYSFCYQNNRERIEELVGRRLAWTKHETKGSAYLYDTVDFGENYGWEKAIEAIKANMHLLLNTFEKVS